MDPQLKPSPWKMQKAQLWSHAMLSRKKNRVHSSGGSGTGAVLVAGTMAVLLGVLAVNVKRMKDEQANRR